MTPVWPPARPQSNPLDHHRNALPDAEIASEIYSTAGDYDMLVKFYVDDETDICHFVSENIQGFKGIENTDRIKCFKAF